VLLATVTAKFVVFLDTLQVQNIFLQVQLRFVALQVTGARRGAKLHRRLTIPRSYAIFLLSKST
jgi:hypothetical protein